MPLMPILGTVVGVALLVVLAWGVRRLWRKHRRLFFGILVLLLAGMGLIFVGLNQDVASEMQVLNPGGSQGKALLVYHPGKSSFPQQVAQAFADGLVVGGWRVEITTASAKAPSDVSGYDLLVLVAPTYGFMPAPSMQRYVRRLDDLHEQRTVTIVTALGAGDSSSEFMQKLVRDVNGNLAKVLLLTTLAPNDDRYGSNDALAIARQAGLELAGSAQ
jgi:flavorubredoxin